MSFHHLSVNRSIAECQRGNLHSAILNLEKERRFYEENLNKLIGYFHNFIWQKHVL